MVHNVGKALIKTSSLTSMKVARVFYLYCAVSVKLALSNKYLFYLSN